jgi:hypothetical protein
VRIEAQWDAGVSGGQNERALDLAYSLSEVASIEALDFSTGIDFSVGKHSPTSFEKKSSNFF